MSLWRIESRFIIVEGNSEIVKPVSTFWVEANDKDEAHRKARDVVGAGRPSAYARAHASKFDIDAVEDETYEIEWDSGEWDA